MIYMIISIGLWVLLSWLAAIKLSFRGPTDYELKRRKDQLELEFRQSIAYLESLRELLSAVVAVCLIMILVWQYGWLIGSLISLVATIFAPVGRRIPIFCTWGDRVIGRYKVHILKIVQHMKPVLAILSHVRPGDPQIVYSRDELHDLIKRSGILDVDEYRRFDAMFSFGSRSVSDIMTPRTMIDTIAADEAIGPLVIDELHRTGHSRFPVCGEDLDHIVGVLYLRDLIDLKRDHRKVSDAMDGRVHYIHQSQTLLHALHGFLRTHHHLFIVVDDTRQTVGVLSLEDVLESMLGQKIVDEFDQFDDLRAVAESNPNKNNLPKGRKDI